MKVLKAAALTTLVFLLSPQKVLAQAIGEYGRTVGNATQRQGNVNPKATGGSAQKGTGKGVIRGVGDVGGRPIAAQLVVAAKEAALYPWQDDEAQVIEQLVQGDKLIPMVQSNGGNDWYMVKTQKGAVGWVKSADVREEAGTITK